MGANVNSIINKFQKRAFTANLTKEFEDKVNVSKMDLSSKSKGEGDGT